MSFIKYLKYSGASVTMTVNPYHWAWIPVIHFGAEIAFEPANSIDIRLLFLTVRIWIDDGSW